jgi:hypothetical protein
MLEERRPVVPRHVLGRVHDVVAVQRGHRDHVQVGEAERLEVADDLVVAFLRPAGEVHLVHRDGDVRHTQDRRDVCVPARLLDHAVPRVDEDDREIGGGRARDHVPRVLDVPGRVGKLKAAPRRHERAVGDVDRDPLLPLRAQAVGEERKVHVRVAAASRRLLDVLHLVDEDLLRVVEEPADQRRLAVVDRAARDEAEELRLHGLLRSSQRACGPPSRPR